MDDIKKPVAGLRPSAGFFFSGLKVGEVVKKLDSDARLDPLAKTY